MAYQLEIFAPPTADCIVAKPRSHTPSVLRGMRDASESAHALVRPLRYKTTSEWLRHDTIPSGSSIIFFGDILEACACAADVAAHTTIMGEIPSTSPSACPPSCLQPPQQRQSCTLTRRRSCAAGPVRRPILGGKKYGPHAAFPAIVDFAIAQCPEHGHVFQLHAVYRREGGSGMYG
jgi:hypothetical protein